MTVRVWRIALGAGIAGLAFALLYVGLEILNEDPQATHSISAPHTPLIWLLASALVFLASYAVATARAGQVRERAVTFGLSVAGTALLALAWAYPMLSQLVRCMEGRGC